MDFEQVLREELEELGRRRPNAEPPARGELIGLCFSGGGIRSSTFNLGIVRGLHRWGLLALVDYLSTVSGGGYIGSHVANLLRIGDEAAILDDRGDPPGVKRLRGLGRFLTPTGSLGEWLEAATSLIRGILWNCSIFMIVAVVLAGAFAVLLDADGEWIFWFPHGVATTVAIIVAVAVLMASVLTPRSPPGGLLVGLLGATILVTLMDALPTLVAVVERWSAALDGSMVTSAIVALIAGGSLPKLPRKLYLLAARIAASLLVIVVPALLFLALLGRFVATEAGPLEAAQLGGAASLLLIFTVVDFNRTSLHDFYKGRIAATFLGDRPPRLSEFGGQPGPLHLVNVALNVPGEPDPAVRDRRADFFSFSCLHVGGPRTGYVPTARFEAAKPDFTLASAVAISGAAAAPNMGSFTDELIRPIMTVLNVRMGYWAPNPRALEAGESGWMPRLPYLIRELRGRLRADTKLVNISDGGHLENLGAFELLRRRCKLIIIGDGEADPRLSFGAMATLIRLAQVELDAEIDIDLDDLRIAENGLSRKHAALGTVRYTDGSVGRILYLKASLTGLEPPEVRYYKEINPAFPHESTADQWFDDAQFDAYRSLGEEVVDSLFQQLGYASPREAAIGPATLAERLAALTVVLAPCSRSRADSLTTQLNEVEDALMREEFDLYRRQLIPTIHAKPIPDERLHALVPVVMMQLQLMENAVDALGLLDVRNREALANRGWMNLFGRWAQSDAFRRVALVCLPSFGANSTQFADVALGLSSACIWAEFPEREQTLALLEQNPERARMIMGLAEYRVEDEAIVVHRLAMRAGLGGRDRVEAAIAALRRQYPTLRFDGAAAAMAAGLPEDAYVHQGHARAWTDEDEAVVSSFTRGHRPEGAEDAFATMMSFEPPGV